MSWWSRWFGKPSPEPPSPVEDPPAVGWQAIVAAFTSHYGDQDPQHWAPDVYRMNDLSDDAAAFDGISAYAADGFWHLVSFGLTELYRKEAGNDPHVSGFGYELTLKIPRIGDTPPAWARQVLEGIGKQVWKGLALGHGHTIQTGPIDGRADTPLDAMLVVRDPAFPEPLDTPHGRVELLLLVGVTSEERQAVTAVRDDPDAIAGLLQERYADNPEQITPLRSQGPFGGA
ncbi:MAG: suppressor of fused domain protein [Myxococcota bacterium]